MSDYNLSCLDHERAIEIGAGVHQHDLSLIVSFLFDHLKCHLMFENNADFIASGKADHYAAEHRG